MPRLFLIPNILSKAEGNCLPAYIYDQIKGVRIFFVEEPKSARRLLKSLGAAFPLNDCRFFDLNEHSDPKEIYGYGKILKEGDCAIISQAGCPCVADPGTDLVFLAHQDRIDIIPLVGPSSILLALMASGLTGQNFAFNGYLPKDRQSRIQKIEALEDRSFKEKQTQSFMETPYRNQNIFEDILAACKDMTNLCIAVDITGSHQSIRTMSIREWKNEPVNLHKKPAMFLIGPPSVVR
jgi:16S rRNA (cytidine1402-2'-O)-methyltransferase